MLEVWGRRNASNVLPVMWTIGEIGIPYIRYDVGGSFGGLDTSEYLAMNPNGRIPTIKDGSHILFESNAIIRYLCRRYGQGTLQPESEAQVSVADQWIEWYKTTPYPKYIDLFWAIVRTEPALRDKDKISKLSEGVASSLNILDQHLATHTYVLGDNISMGDVPLGALAHRYFRLDVERPELPNVEVWYKRLCQRKAYQEHVMFEFGSNPAEWYHFETSSGQDTSHSENHS